MLSIFPYLLAFEGFSPLLLRITLGAVCFLWGYRRLKRRSNSQETGLGIVEIMIGIFLIIGLFTQIASLVSAVILIVRLWRKVEQKAFLTDGINYYLILLIISISLLLTGPGFIAFDLPL